MAEIKTCEGYVLNRLQEMEDANEGLKDNLEALAFNLKQVEEELSRFKSILEKHAVIRNFKSDVDGEESQYVSLTSVHNWSYDDTGDFDFLVSHLNIQQECKEEESNASISN